MASAENIQKLKKIRLRAKELKSMTLADKINELDAIYNVCLSILNVNDSYLNFQIIEIIDVTYDEAIKDNVPAAYLEKFLLLKDDIQNNYEISTENTIESDMKFIEEFSKGFGEMNPIYTLDDIVDIIVEKIVVMPLDEESSIVSLVRQEGQEYKIDEMFQIQIRVLEKCKNKGILLDYSKYDGKDVGLPFNLTFIKKELQEKK